MLDVCVLEKMSKDIRKEIISVGDYCKGKIHWGSSLSCVEIMNLLYAHYLSINGEETNNDVFVVSKGHAALALYATMKVNNLIDDNYLELYQQDGSEYPEEITMNSKLNIPCSTGSLGVGISYAAGKALAYKRKRIPNMVYVLVGDGECNEGSVWETVMFANHYCLDNLVVIIDSNCLQADGLTKEIMDMGDLQIKFQAFGWKSCTVDGHDYNELISAFETEHRGRPLAIIAKTVKGKGVSFMENDFSWHDHILDRNLLDKAKEEVGLI